MIKTPLREMLHKETSPVVKKLLETVPNAYIENKLDDRLAEVGINQKQLALLTGLREGSISDFVNGRKINISKYQLLALMIGLRLTDIKDLIDVTFPDDVVKQFKNERAIWMDGGEDSIPRDIQTHYIRSLED